MRIAVIGVGPRGLSAFERIVSHAQRGGPSVEVLLIEPGPLGSGTHGTNHPDYVLLNTIAAQ
ncbi:MAG: FAD/NAD(P)-binding protein, partial [Micromonosporaceae bacterium]